jgi:hypothetical protein
MARPKYKTEVAPSKHQKVDPLEDPYYQFYQERKCRNCQLFKQSEFSTKVGICLQRGCVVSAHWDCILDADGKLRVTRQKVVR